MPDHDPGGSGEFFTVNQLAHQLDVTPRAIRLYEAKGLLRPRRAGTTRIFDRRDRARLLLVLRGKRLGFSLAEIREMIDLYDIGDGRRAQREVTIARCRDRIALLSAQKNDIDAAIEELTHFIAVIEPGLA